MTSTNSPQEFSEPQPPAEPPKRWSTGLIVTAAVGALVIVMAAAITITLAVIGSNDPKALIPACQDQVKARLKTPATAKFPGGEAIDESDTESTIIGAVDAQNGFGALIRSEYRCVLTKDSKGDWQVSTVTLGK